MDLSSPAPGDVFLQGQAHVGDLMGELFTHIAIVPGFIDDAGDVAALGGIAEDKAVIGGMLLQPLLGAGGLLPFGEIGIGLVDDVGGQTELVLAGAGVGDLFGGQEDLRRGVIRCVGDPDERFDEDALRILRAVRFSAQLGFSIDPKTRSAVRRHAEELQKISVERIRVELMKLLVSDHPGRLRDLYELGLTAQFLPEFDVCMETPQNTPHHAYSVGEHTIRTVENIEADPILRLTMLLHDFGKPDRRLVDKNGKDHFPSHPARSAEMAEDILKRLKFDNKTIERVVNLVRWHDRRPKHTEKSVRRTLWRIGPENFEDYLKVRRADDSGKSDYKKEEKAADILGTERIGRRILEERDPMSVRELAISGKELLELGAKGKEIGAILDGALQLVLKNPEANTREYLLEYAAFEHKMWQLDGEIV